MGNLAGGGVAGGRMLEDGRVDESDKKKDDVEELQRDRRRQMTNRGEEHQPRFFKSVPLRIGIRMLQYPCYATRWRRD